MRLDLGCVDRNRIKVVVDPKLDGVIKINPTCYVLRLDGNYVPVRIATEDGYYVKGLAIYSGHVPNGIDVIVYSKTGDPFRKFEADDAPFDYSDTQKQAVYEYLKQADDRLKSFRDALIYNGLY